jgi:hypothetical protein
MPQSLLTGQLKEKPTKRVWCLYSSFIHDSSYRRDFGIYRKEDVQFQLKIRGASEKFKNQPWPLLRPTSVNFRQHVEMRQSQLKIFN